MSNGKTLSPHERLAACFLFFFQAGMDAKTALSEGAARVNVPTPSEEDLHRVMDSTGIGTWRGVEPFARAMAEHVANNTARNPVDVARDVANVVRRGQQALEKFAGGPVDIANLGEQFGKRGRK